MYKNKYIKTFLCLSLCLSCILSGCGSNKKSESKKQNREDYLYTGTEDDKTEEEYKTTVVTKGDFEASVFANGTIQYLDQSTIKMDVNNAIFGEFTVGVGDKVKVGDVVAKYAVEEDEVYVTQQTMTVEQAESEYASNLKTKKAAISEQEYKISLMPTGADKEIAKSQLEKMKMDYSEFLKTEETVKQQRTDLNDYLAEIKKTKVVSDVEGEVISLAEVSAGDTLGGGTALVTVAKKKKFLIEIPNEDGAAKYNMDVSVMLGSDSNSIDVTMKGKVVYASNIFTPDKQTDTALVAVIDPPEDANWKKNIFVEYPTKSAKNVLLVPENAIFTESEGVEGTTEDGQQSTADAILNSMHMNGEVGDQKLYVMILKDGITKKRYVTAAGKNSDVYWILDGVQEGDTVVLNK